MTLSLFLLGPFLAKVGPNQSITMTSKKAQALLAYLVVEGGRAHYREALAGLLWPDFAEGAARSNLRQALQILRRAVGDEGAPAAPLFLLSRETVQINPEAQYWLDVAEFDRAAPRPAPAQPSAPSPGRPRQQAEDGDIQALRAAVALYRGPFLEGLSLGGAQGDSPAFEEWMVLKREYYNSRMLRALAALSALYEARGAYDEALACVQRNLLLEPWQEEAHQQAMRLLTLMGRRSDALAQYRRCREVLLSELGAEPAPETIDLYERILGAASLPSQPQATASANPPVLASPPPARLDPSSPPLVARDEEMARLGAYLSLALAGEGRVVFISGEAGSGKTALVEEFARQAMAAHGDLLVTMGRCSAHGGAGDAYEPFLEALRILAGDPQGALGARHTRRLDSARALILETLVQHAPEFMHILARDPALVGRARDVRRNAGSSSASRGAGWISRLEALATSTGPPLLGAMQQSTLGEQTARALRAIAERQPLLLVLDDLQWADLASLDLLSHLGRRLRGARILIVAAYRTQDVALASPWSPAAQRVGRSGEAETGRAAHPLAAMADEFQRLWGDVRIDLTQAEPTRFVNAFLDLWPNRLRSPFRQALARHTGGNALFVVELVRAMQERGDLLRDGQGRWVEGPDLAWDKLPPRVEGAISYRIGQLAPAQQEMLEVASVEGEQFHAEVLAHVLGLPLQGVVATLSGALGRQARLVAPHGPVQVGGRELARYRFRHAMFQSYLYERLDATVRAQLHGAVGAAIEALYAEEARRLAVDLARHHQEAGQTAKTARYLLEAGRRMADLGAHREAIASYERALALLPGEFSLAERLELEFALNALLDLSLLYVEGWGSPKRLRTTERTYELGRRGGWSTPAMLDALQYKVSLHTARGDYALAVELAHELLGAAERLNDRAHMAVAQTLLGRCSMMRGELAEAQAHIARAISVDRGAESGERAAQVASLVPQREIVAALVLLPLGYPDRALQHLERGLAALDTGLWPEFEVYTRSVAGLLLAAGRMDRLAQGEGDKIVQISAGRDMPEMEAWGNMLLGWAEARAGQAQGVARISKALEAQRPRGTFMGQYLREMLLAEAHLAAGQAQQALEVIDRALADLERTGTRYTESLFYGLRGEAWSQGAIPTVMAPGTPAIDPAACFRRAIEVAHQQGARLWELRASTRLARWLRQEGRPQEARQALAALYATFDEGFDAPDLVEARAELAEGLP